MLKQLKRLTLRLIAGANVGTIGLMLLVGYSDRLEPASFPVLSVVGLAFPVLLAVNVAFLVFWLLVKPRYALIPVAGLLAGFGPVRSYCPLNLRHDADSTLTVMTYNVYNYRRLPDGDFRQQVIDYLRSQQADIVCLQELTLRKGDKEDLADLYAYTDTALHRHSGGVVTVLSRYPIVGHDAINTGPGFHRSGAFHVVVDGDTITVINNHLEGTGISATDRVRFNKMVTGDIESKEAAEAESRKIIDGLSSTVVVRSQQVQLVAAYVDSLRQLPDGPRPIILCGDFNDSPISYAHHAFARRLTDCYRESGLGPGISYHANKFYVRIDHLFCSAEWEPRAARVDQKMTISDHYPVLCKLKKRPKP